MVFTPTLLPLLSPDSFPISLPTRPSYLLSPARRVQALSYYPPSHSASVMSMFYPACFYSLLQYESTPFSLFCSTYFTLYSVVTTTSPCFFLSCLVNAVRSTMYCLVLQWSWSVPPGWVEFERLQVVVLRVVGFEILKQYL